MRKPSILPTLVLYVAATMAFLLLLFLFLDTQGLSWENVGIAMALLLPAVAAVGYLLLSDLAESKRRQDDRLEHLTREILHEINLPISTIETNIALLARRLESERDRTRLERIGASLMRLRRLYDELSYSIRREIHAVAPEAFDVAQTVRERVAVLEEMGRNRFELLLEPCTIVADRIGWEQVLDNVLENAMKYSPVDQPVAITLEATKLTIRDHGIGMDSTQIARIYERYYQSDSHSPGEGIGLALVKRYCDEMGIGIRIDSEPNVGTMVMLDCAQVIQK